MAGSKRTSRKRKASKQVCRKVKVKLQGGRRRTKTVCRPRKRKVVVKKPAAAVAPPVVLAPPTAGTPVAPPSPAAPPVTTAPPPEPTAAGLPVYAGPFGVAQAQRLLWRAGFGPRRGEAEALAGAGIVAAVRSLTRPAGAASLVGAAPTVDGAAIAPRDAWGHDHLWWLDRMVRSDQPLVERMTLVWHDWFATSNDGVNSNALMLDQNETLRRHALGSFHELLVDVTKDPAMLLWLGGAFSSRWAPNENYAREVMELFTLGADRGAYTEADVRELARALTGWLADYSDELGFHDFRFEPGWWDPDAKTLWADTDHERRGAFDWRDACALVTEHPLHPSFFVRKLWSYFVPSPPDGATQAALEALYVDRGHAIAPVVEAILLHPDLYAGAPLVKPPAVYTAGLLRATGQTITDDSWAWLGSLAGQQLFYPPNVSGWNDAAWLDTSRLYGRWYIALRVLAPLLRSGADYAGSAPTAAQLLAAAHDLLARPALTPETYGALLAFAELPAPHDASAADGRALRANALRQLLATCPDAQVC